MYICNRVPLVHLWSRMPGMHLWTGQPAHKELICTIVIHKVLQMKLQLHPGMAKAHFGMYSTLTNPPTQAALQGPASPDTLEVVFASIFPSVLCNFLLEQADGGNEECKKELDRILAAVASRNLCANVSDVHAGSEENQSSNKRQRRKETHARVNSQDLCQKAFIQRHSSGKHAAPQRLQA
jgi:hypothetical protein